jgi:hypothetical protein
MWLNGCYPRNDEPFADESTASVGGIAFSFARADSERQENLTSAALNGSCAFGKKWRKPLIRCVGGRAETGNSRARSPLEKTTRCLGKCGVRGLRKRSILTALVKLAHVGACRKQWMHRLRSARCEVGHAGVDVCSGGQDMDALMRSRAGLLLQARTGVCVEISAAARECSRTLASRPAGWLLIRRDSRAASSRYGPDRS